MAKTVFGKYVLKCLIRAQEPCIKVFRATQLGFDRDVELRVLYRALKDDSEESRRFFAQFRNLVRLDHPNITNLLDVGRSRTKAYYTTVYRNAVSMASLLAGIGGPMKRCEIVEVARSIGRALEHIHHLDLVHRDISMESVFFDLDNNRPYISGFTLLRGLGTSHITVSGAKTLKTVMTPELFGGEEYSKQTDLFLLGALLYELATFRSPFDSVAGKGPDAVWTIAHPCLVNLGFSVHLADLIMKLLQKDPGDRYESASDFLAELDRIEPLMEAQSLISTERKEILDALIRKPVFSGEAREEASGQLDEDLLCDATERNPGGRMDFSAFALLFIVFGLLSALLWFPAAAPGNSIEKEILKAARALSWSRITERNFKSRLALLEKYSASLPLSKRRKLLSYSRMTSLRLLFYRNPELACAELEEEFYRLSSAIRRAASR